MSLQTVKKNVKKLLENNREIRDDYAKLVLMYWVKCDKIDPEMNLKQAYRQKLTSTESITRASRNLQKVYSHLRGFRHGNTNAIEEDYKKEFKHN